MRLSEVHKRFDSLDLPDPGDIWTRIDGQRLIMTPSRYCIFEDLSGKLMKPLPQWFIVGRDERRAITQLRIIAKNISLEFAKTLMVDRSLLFGKTRTLNTKPIKKRECQVSYTAVFWPPRKLFVCYETPKGSILYREVIGERTPT